MKNIFLLLVLLFVGGLGCTKTFRVSSPVSPELINKTFAAGPNEIYYALRWALRTYGYPIAEEDLHNGVLKTRFVPVKANSHYVEVFGKKDFGVTGAYHQLEVRLIPQNGSTKVQIGSRIQGVISKLKSNGTEETMILSKVKDYLRSPNMQVTNLGVKE